MITLDAVVLGGGLGKRFSKDPENIDNSSLPKQFNPIQGIPLFLHSLKAFLSMGCFRQLVVVVPKDFVELAQNNISDYLKHENKTIVRVIAGGETRQESSTLGVEALESLSPSPTRVLIHDACRPYLTASFLKRIHEALMDRAFGAWIPGIPVTDTIKKVDNAQVVETIPREKLFLAQTPQVFEYALIRNLLDKLKDNPELSFTDDASMCEYYGIPVGVFEGDIRNLKLTYGFELETLRNYFLQNLQNQEPPECESESDTTYTA